LTLPFLGSLQMTLSLLSRLKSEGAGCGREKSLLSFPFRLFSRFGSLDGFLNRDVSNGTRL
jgi:hypothetical protein